MYNIIPCIILNGLSCYCSPLFLLKMLFFPFVKALSPSLNMKKTLYLFFIKFVTEDWDNWTGDSKAGGTDDAGGEDEYYDDWNHEPGVDDPDFIVST